MRKIIISAITIFNMLFLCSCSLGGLRMLNTDSDDEQKIARFEQVIEAIKNEDKDALKALFSKQATIDTDDFDGGVDDLFQFMQGEIDSWEKSVGGSVTKLKENGHEKKEVDSYFYVTTNKQKYFFLLEDCPVDTENPDNVGLYLLLIVKAEDEEKIYEDDQKILYDGDKELSPSGIYVPIK